MALKLNQLSGQVAVAGTAVRLSVTSILSRKILFQVNPGLTGTIFIGGEGVTSENGIIMAAGSRETLLISPSSTRSDNLAFDLKDIWVNSDTNNAGFRAVFVEET